MKLEGTLIRRFLQISIFPAFLILTYFIGQNLAEGGYTSRTYLGTLLMFLIYGVIFAPLERLIPFSRKWLRGNDAESDLLLFFGGRFWHIFLTLPLQLAILSIAVAFISPAIGQSIWPTSWPAIIQVFLLVAVLDFFNYWFHRWMHTVPLMWCWHAVHHSSQRLYWFNGLRLHPLQGMVESLLWAIPLAFVQAPVEIVFTAGLLSRTLGRLQHTNMDLSLGPLDHVFSSPKNHRYHHSRNPEESNSNYGLDLMLWDHLFGTFYLPKGRTPSDVIGLDNMQDYPASFAGLMLAPFNHRKYQVQTGQPVPSASRNKR